MLHSQRSVKNFNYINMIPKWIKFMPDLAQGKSSGSHSSQTSFRGFLQIIYFDAQKPRVLLNKHKEYPCTGAEMNLKAPLWSKAVFLSVLIGRVGLESGTQITPILCTSSSGSQRAGK